MKIKPRISVYIYEYKVKQKNGSSNIRKEGGREKRKGGRRKRERENKERTVN